MVVGVSAKDNQGKMTIFYNGMVAACDITEFQARLIILLASRESDKNRVAMLSSSPILKSPVPGLAEMAGLSMKRSLKRFLEKRKARGEGIAPYSTQRRGEEC